MPDCLPDNRDVSPYNHHLSSSHCFLKNICSRLCSDILLYEILSKISLEINCILPSLCLFSYYILDYHNQWKIRRVQNQKYPFVYPDLWIESIITSFPDSLPFSLSVPDIFHIFLPASRYHQTGNDTRTCLHPQFLHIRPHPVHLQKT